MIRRLAAITVPVIAAALLAGAAIGLATSGPALLPFAAHHAAPVAQAPANPQGDLPDESGAPAVAGSQVAQSPSSSATAPARPCTLCPPCPVVLTPTANPVFNCSPPCPPLAASPVAPCRPFPPPQPPPGHAVIFFCPFPLSLQVQPGIVQLQGSVCGAGFHPAELITLHASGLRGNVSWQVRASPTGAFRTSLPSTLCRILPVTLMATGSAGSHSNVLLLRPASCLTLP